MIRLRLPDWASHDAAQAAVHEALERSDKVEKQIAETRSVASRLKIFREDNHFQESILNMFGVKR